MKIKNVFYISIIAVLMAGSVPSMASELNPSYLYNLSNFSGTIPYDWSRVVVDTERDEVYVLYQNLVKVFNENGMEIFSFGEDGDLGNLVDISVNKEGNILLLSYKETQSEIIRCNFRGERVGRIEIKNLPPEFSKFSPNRMAYLNGEIYMASQSGMRVVVTDYEGNFKNGYDIISILGLNEKDRADTQMDGFSVDKNGNMLFTIPVFFTAYRLSYDGKIESFGKRGSLPGEFSIISGIVSDRNGNLLVADKLRCVVMVFDNNFKFIAEFGHRGLKPGNLIIPNELALDSKDRVYVAQGQRRGVSVYKLSYN